MLRGNVEGKIALLSEGSSAKESPEDKQASAPCVWGRTLMWGAHLWIHLCSILLCYIYFTFWLIMSGSGSNHPVQGSILLSKCWQNPISVFKASHYIIYLVVCFEVSQKLFRRFGSNSHGRHNFLSACLNHVAVGFLYVRSRFINVNQLLLQYSITFSLKYREFLSVVLKENILTKWLYFLWTLYREWEAESFANMNLIGYLARKILNDSGRASFPLLICFYF